ncbi:hypothetical protein M0G43_13830 [Subsaxibacter sp. CAU 1640]|uniref:hypothetical protein n=1 Tax=Subsaxibacter sp. CAU 1640 TaxID=2933271 RepID=UPI00200443CF|nr:hypothetical protein [Subsaxibacter sp. CAU 1640]MCK7591663.1 hypothetical protein [Subsaxibacter sp. CAU 1640]
MKTTRLFKTFITLAFLSFSFMGFAQNTPKEIVSKFFNEYKTEGAAIALDNLYANNQWILQAEDAVTDLKQKISSLTEDYVGKFYGYELITEKKLSDSFILMSYLVKFDRQPIRFTFQFYKPYDQWRTHSFQYDGNIDDELEEAAKVPNLSLKN